MTEMPDDYRRADGPSAFDRVQTRDEGEAGSPARLWPLLLALLLIGAVLTTWRLWPDAGSEDNVLVHLVETTDTFLADLNTVQADEAQAFVLDQLGWDVRPPDLPALTVVGVGIPSIGEVRPAPNASAVEVQVPAFRYEGRTDQERALVFAYDYILLDRVGEAFDLPEGTYAALSEPTPVDSRVVNGRFVVSWRRRAMVFSAVTPDEAVAEQIRQAVSS